MLDLPILNVRLSACHEDWQQMTSTEQGRHCARCNRTVQDFTHSPLAELEAAFLASPDGRVCGRFRAGQLAPRPQVRLKLRQFLVALVLVCGLGLSGREAVAQVVYDTVRTNAYVPWVYGGVEQMPTYQDGGQEGLLRFIGENIQWPDTVSKTLRGRVFIHFQITETGAVRDVTVLQSLHPALDAEAARVVALLNGKFVPGRQNDRPVSVSYTIPITFQGREPVTEPASNKRLRKRP